jgi:hypothetical protein
VFAVMGSASSPLTSRRGIGLRFKCVPSSKCRTPGNSCETHWVKKKKNQNRTEQNKERASEERNTTNTTLERA